MTSTLRRRLFAALSLVTALVVVTNLTHSSVTPAVAAPPPMYAYTSAQSGHWSYKIDGSNHTIAASLGDFSTNTNWRCSWNTNIVNRAGTKVYQGRSCDNVITEIDVATNATRNLAINMRSNAMAISPDDRYIYTAEPYYINKWDLSTTPPTNVGGGSRDDNNAGISLAILPNGSKLYSPSIQAGKNKVQVYNSSLQLIATVTHASMVTPQWALAKPDGTEVWVGMGTTFIVIDTATDTISQTYSVSYGTGSFPSFNADGSRLWLSSGNGLLEINTSDASIVRTIAGLNGGSHASISPDNSVVYVAYGQTQKWAKTSDGSTGTITLPTQTPNNDTPRTIVWAQPVEAPSITLSSSSGTANVDNAVNLYSISNSGGNVNSYSISPSSLPAGLSFSTSTGLITGAPTVTQSATTYTITATNPGGSSSRTFSLTVTDPPDGVLPTFTTPVSTNDGFTTTISNYSANYSYTTSATNGATVARSGAQITVSGLTPSATSTVSVVASRTGFRPVTATVNGRALDPVTTTTAPAAAVNNTTSGTSDETSTQTRNGTMTGAGVPTTSSSSTTSTTTTTIPAPEAPAAEPGEGLVMVGGKATTATVTRSNNKITVGAAGINVTFSGISSDGDIIPLDSDGNMRVVGDDIVAIDGSGFAPNSDIEVWMFSTPRMLTKISSDSAGRVTENVTLPGVLEEGDHRFVLNGESASGDDALVGLGLIVGYEGEGLSTTGKFLIALPIALAILMGLLIPTAIRRRRDDEDEVVASAAQ